MVGSEEALADHRDRHDRTLSTEHDGREQEARQGFDDRDAGANGQRSPGEGLSVFRW